jgi:DNA-directed RNA polymerase specialized sigma24 family protein
MHSPDAIDPAIAADLRRSRERELSDLISMRARWLLPEDRALLLAVYRDGMQASDVATLRGESVRATRHRLRVLVQRVLDPTFLFVMRQRDSWPATRRRVATARFLQGRTLRACSKHLQLSLHAVRRHVEAVRLLAESSGRQT